MIEVEDSTTLFSKQVVEMIVEDVVDSVAEVLEAGPVDEALGSPVSPSFRFPVA